jgi:hypothetical protein
LVELEGDEPSYRNVSQEKCPPGWKNKRQSFGPIIILLALMVFLLLSSAQSVMVKIGEYDTPGDAWRVAVDGSYAYVADGNQGLQI